MQKKIGLVIGSTADLPEDFINQYKEKYGLDVIPFKVDWPNMDTFPGDNIYQKMIAAEKTGNKDFPKTSQPNPFNYSTVFKEALKNAEKIICLTISYKLSGGYNSAILGLKTLSPEDQKRVFVVDTLNATVGEGMVVYQVIRYLEMGRDAEEVVAEIEQTKKRVTLIGMIGDPKWLEYGGRLSGAIASAMRQLAKINIKPIIGIVDGSIVSINFKIHAKKSSEALHREFVSKTKKDRDNGIIYQVAIGDADFKEGVAELKSLLQGENNVEIVFEKIAGPIIGTHVGPGSLLLSWCAKA